MSRGDAQGGPISSFEPCPASHPDHLAVAAMLNGIDVTYPAESSVLELACSDGSNLIPMAFHMPGARFVGIEPSKAHAAQAQAAVERLGLKNVEIICDDLTQIERQERAFDAIIVRDLVSTISEAARRRVLDLCRSVMVETGVIYLDYLTRAGWLVGSQLREQLRRQVDAIDTVGEKLGTLRELLAILDDDGLEMKSPQTLLAKLEVRIARSLDDRRLALQFLSPHHQCFDHSEIARLAREQGLVAFDFGWDPSMERMAELRILKRLESLRDRGVEAHDLVTLMTGPRQRAVLLCKPSSRPAEPDSVTPALDRGTFAAQLETRIKDVLLDADIEVAFVSQSGHMVRTKEPFNKAVLTTLMNAWPGGYGLSELYERASAMLREKVPARGSPSGEVLEAQTRELLSLRATGIVSWRSREVTTAASVPDRPKAFDVSVWQASRSHVLTDTMHRLVAVDEFTRRLVPLLDGSRDRDALVAAMRSKLEAGELVFKDDGKQKKESPESLVPRLVAGALEGLTKAGVIEG